MKIRWWHYLGWFLFRYHERNPARRYCKLCDQQQDNYAHDWQSPGWWEDICPVLAPHCVCHNHSRYIR